MSKAIRYPINVIRVLNTFVEYPQGAMTIDNLLYERGLRKETTEKQVREAIGYLIRKKILKEIRPWGAIPKSENNLAEYERKYHYEISKTIYAFQQVLNIFPTEDINKLLESDYSNGMIGDNGFERIYRAILPCLSIPGFKQFASKSLLHHRATEDEYVNFANELKTKILESYNQSANNGEIEKEPVEVSHFLIELGQELSMSSIKPIEILSSFDPLHAVRFYRKTLHQSILKAYDELAERTFITKGLRNFLAFDNYLSPLTAHPLNSISKLLFANPFERIYENAYLLDGEAFWVLSGRAAVIYNNFPDFLFEYLKYDYMKRENIELFIKEMIYSWNVASTRFDMVYYYLGDIIEKKIGSGNYHLKSHGLNYDIIDLNSGKSLLNPYISSSMLVFDSVPLAFKPYQNGERIHPKMMEDPFTCLRQCNTFEGSEWRAKLWRPDILSFENIFSDIKDKIDQTNSWMKDSAFTP